MRLRARVRTLNAVELVNFVLALGIMGLAWFVAVRVLAWTLTRGAERAPARKALPANRGARIRHFVASMRHSGVR